MTFDAKMTAASALSPRAPRALRRDGVVPDRSWPIRVGRRVRGALDRAIAASSLVSNEAVLDVRDFAWTALLRERWREILAEAHGVAGPDDAMGRWRSVALREPGGAPAAALARCPVTAAAIARIPGLDAAGFSILPPGAHVPVRRGESKRVITCHLALVVPRDGDARMRVHDRVVRWAAGETLLFDDTYDHEVWNDTGGPHVVLLIRFERPLRHPGKWLAGLVRGAMRSPLRAR